MVNDCLPVKSNSQNSTLTEETKQYTYKGLTITAIKKSGVLRIKITGTANSALGTNDKYVTIASLPSNFSIKNGAYKFVLFYIEKSCQLQILSSGAVQLGYSRSNNTSKDIVPGDGVRIDESFVM